MQRGYGSVHLPGQVDVALGSGIALVPHELLEGVRSELVRIHRRKAHRICLQLAARLKPPAEPARRRSTSAWLG
jgi:hypothetical protein